MTEIVEVDKPSEILSTPTVALRFEQLTDAVKVKNATCLGLEDQFTFAVWIQPTSSTLQQDYFLVVHIANNYALSFGNGNVQVAFRNEKPGWMWKKTSITLTMGRWTHIAVAYDAAHKTAVIMKDGVNVEAMVIKGKLALNVNHLIVKLLRLSANKDDEVIASPNTGEENSFAGMIAHLKIWRAVLSDNQIRQQLLRPSMEDKNLLCWWKFDEGYGNTVSDSLNNAPQGNTLGCRWWMAPNATGSVPVPPSTLQHDLRQMFNNEVSSDIQLAVEGGEGKLIYAHRVLLAARSETFKAMLQAQFSESNQKLVIVKDISHDILSWVVEYLYTDSVAIDEKNVVDLFVGADRFQVMRLRSQCENFLLRSIDEDNVCHVLELADRVNASELRHFCMNWILSNFGDVLRKGDHLLLPKELQQEINAHVADQYFPNKRRKIAP